MALDPREFLKGRDASEPIPAAPLAGSRAEAMHRLQIGFLGIVGMVLLIALADVVSSRVQQTEATAVPEAAPTTEPSETPAATDPLAEAGVVPELPAEPTPTTGASPSTQDVPPPSPVQNAPLQ
ncbi:MAG: hypothetical protein WBA68_05150 [Alteraurantiacibacter sp.]